MYKRHISSLNSELSERCGARKRRRTNDGGWKDACTTNDNDDDGASEMDEETAAKEKMKKLIAEKQALEDEMRKVQAILDDHQRRREEHEYDAKKCTQCGKAAMLHCEAGDGEYEECMSEEYYCSKNCDQRRKCQCDRALCEWCFGRETCDWCGEKVCQSCVKHCEEYLENHPNRCVANFRDVTVCEICYDNDAYNENSVLF
mmetsp:Transcript_30407/g.49491  ORF Transcript_30407/g.49491 Transcript_30407/m.49491 type:complete len:202 (+) Transcript_30407:40-645(+)